MQTIDLSDLSVICGLWTCHYLFWSNVYIPRLSNCLMSIHVFIVRCVGGSKALPVLHSSYRTVFERDCAVWRTARRGRPNLCFSKVWRTQQRVRQPGEPQDAFASCFNPLASAKIGRTLAQFLNGTVLYDGRQGESGRTFAFPRFGERVRQPGEPQDAFASCFNPLASAKIGRSILTLAACGLSPVDSPRLLPGAFESPTSTINLL